MNDVIRAAAELQAFCEAHRWRFCFIGGVALMRWGQPRETVDADLSLLTGFGQESAFVQPLLQRFAPRIADAAAFAEQNRVLLLRAGNGVGLDVSLAAVEYEATVIERSSVFDYPTNVTLRTCSAEDLVILKAFAGRTRDWADIENILSRQAGKLDWTFIRKHLLALCELQEDPKLLERLESLRRQSESE